MSFAGVSHKPRATVRPGSSGGVKTSKLRARRKPAWDSTVNDLTALKATPEELDRRKNSHRSQHIDLVKEEQVKNKIMKAHRRNRRDLSSARSSVLQEILLDNSQLEETLANSNLLLSAVRSVLSEDHKRVQGMPNVTHAPTGKTKTSGRGLFDVPATHLDELSDSVMDRKALNEEPDRSWSSSESEEGESAAVDYQPQMDLSRFQRLIQELDKEKCDSNHNGNAMKAARDILSIVEQHTGKPSTKPAVEKGRGGGKGNVAEGTVAERPGKARQVLEDTPSSSPVKELAINDTAKVNRTRSRIDQGSTSGDGVPTMLDFNKILETLNDNLCDYEKQTGRAANSSLPPPNSYTGYTHALLDAVARMSCYFKENGSHLRAESVFRDKLIQEIQRLSGLVDALTTDIIAIQEAYARMRNDFVKHQRETDHQLLTIRRVLAQNGIVVPTVSLQPSYFQQPMVQPSLLQPAAAQLPVVGPNTSGASGHSAGENALSRDSTVMHSSNNNSKPELIDRTSFVGSNLLPKPVFYPSQMQATLLQPPQQMDSPSVASGRQVHHPSKSLEDVRGVLRFDGETASTSNGQASGFLPVHASYHMLSKPASNPNPVGVSTSRISDLPSQMQPPASNPAPEHVLTVDRRAHLLGASQQTTATELLTASNELISQQTSVEEQLAEISRQEAEARKRLQEMIEKQQREVQGMFVRQTVSPPISPITVESESSAVVGLKNNPLRPVYVNGAAATLANVNEMRQTVPHMKADPMLSTQIPGPARQIKVTVPQVPSSEEMSDNSPNLIQGNVAKRIPTSSVPIVGKPAPANAQGTKNGGFFALTTHIPTR